MDKNKNRTDLLAAGRKKLQQFRQKKDSKGSKSSGKSSKSDHDVVADEAPSVTKPVKGNKERRDVDGPGQGSATELVDSSSRGSTEHLVASNANVGTLDPSSTSNLSREDSGVGEDGSRLRLINDYYVDAAVPDEDVQSSNLDNGMLPVSSLEKFNVEGKHESGHAPVMPVGLKAVLDYANARKVRESMPARGEDQVPDVGAIQEGNYSGLEPASTSSLTDLDGNTNNALPGLDEIPQVNLEDAQEATKMEYTSRETAQSSEHDNFPAFAGTADDQDAMKPDTHSLSISDGFPTSTPEPTIHPKEDAVPGVHGREDMKLLNASGDSEFGSMGSHTVSGEEVDPVVSLTQLAKLLQLLGEDEFRFLVCQRESLSGIRLKNDPGFNLSMCSSSEFFERLKEQLYVATLEKEMIYLQLCEQWGVEKEFDYHHLQGDHDNSAVSASFDDVQGKKKYLFDELARCRSELDSVANERVELQKHITSSKIELNRFSSRIDELQTELARSEHQLSSVSAELVDCKGLLADLRVRNEDLKASVASMTEEKNKLEQESRDGALKNEKLATELKECNALLELSQVENVNSRGSLALIAEEKAKLEEEQQNYVRENNKLLAEVSEWKNSAEAIQVENANLNCILTSEREDRSKLEEAKEYLVQENEKLSTELLEFQHLVEAHREEIANLNGSVDLVMKERNTLGEEMDHLKLKEEKHLTELTNCKNSMMNLQVKYENAMDDLKDSALHLERLTEENATLSSTLESYEAKMREFDVHTIKSEKSASEERILLEDSSEFLDWKRHLRGMEKIIQVLGKAIEGMHFHSASLSRSGKAAGAGVSKLIQAFEPKQTDDESEETGIRGGADTYMLAREQISNLKALYKDLVLDAEHAYELFKGEQSSKHLSDTKLRELVLHVEALNGQCNNLEETFIKHVVLDEALRQYVSTIEAKKGEIVVLCEDMRREETITKSKNYELTRKLCTFESRISELQVQVDELQQRSDYIATLEHQLETLHRKLDASIVTVSSTLSSAAGDSQDVGTRVATSVDAAIAVIQDLQGKLEDAHRNYNLLSSSYEDVTGKTKDLEGKSELTANLLHKIYDNLQKLVNDSHPYTEESQNNFGREELVDPFHISNYDILIEQLGKLIVERGQLESMNKKQMSELLEREKDIEELSRRCISSDLIVKLLGDIESVVSVDGIEIEPSQLVSSVESITRLLIEKYRSAQEQVGLFREKLKSKEMELIELQSQIDHLSFSIVPYENENHIFKESLRSAMDQLVTFQSQIQLKETELQQSEQRVSALREKLHIAVTKGKGLISQRDSLKQSLSATSSELEKCLHELQLKDATLQETEIKLKTYSEAGERMEALESELSYIRNSATALRESFLLKDSVLQRIEEILEDLELPEHFHAKDIIEKIDWLAKSVSGNTFPVSSWDQKSSTEAGSYPESGFGATEGWKEDLQPASVPADELRRNYEELQSKFYSLAEQSEMLEQSLMEQNNLVQQWEELLDKINMPPQLRSLEPEDRIEWLQGALSEANGRCDSLQKNIYNLENVRESLTGDIEDSQRRLSDLEAALESVTNEREQLAVRLEVLSRDYDKVYQEADDRCNSLQQNVYNLENVCGSLTANLEDSNRRLADLEAALESATNEREQLSASLEVLRNDYDKISEKAASYEIENYKLLNEVDKLQLKLDEKRVDEEHMHHVRSEIRRLQDLIKDTVEDSETEDLNSSTSDILCLERLLRKLVDKCREHSSVQHVAGLVVEEHIPEDISWSHGKGRTIQAGNCEDLDTASLEKKLEDAEGDLMRMKEEKDKHAERNQSLEHEVKELEVKNQELQKLLIQEEQKSASVKEKLNVAVRKGKTLVQQRDSMRQSINDLTSEVERLNSDIKTRENLLSEYEQKIKDLSTSQKNLEEIESEIRFLRTQFAEADSELQDKRHTLSMILGALADIDLGVELRIIDPIEKLKQIEKVWHDLHSAISLSEQDSRKSKRAAELLLAELNEVQERNEDLQEELSKAKMEISELSKERDLAEAAKCESLARLEQLSALHSEGRNSQVSELMALKSGLEQLRPGFMEINTLLSDILPKDLELLYNLGASMKTLLESRDASNVGGQTLIGASSGILSKSENKVNFLHSESFLDSKMREQFGDDHIIDLWRSLRSDFQDLATEIVAFDEKLHRHSKSLHEEVILLVETLHRELTSHKYSLESAKEEISQLEITCKQKEIDNLTMRGYATMLYEACKNSILEIEKCKAQIVAHDADAGVPRYDVKSIDGRDIFSGKTLPSSEEYITSTVNRLLSLVKDFHSIQAESVEVSQKEMKATISSLQKELRDKDTEKDKICVELISQIKQAEATAMSKLQELENAKAHIEFLQGQLEEVHEQHNVLEQRVKELQGQETNLIGLQERVKSLTDALTSKEQEAEALLQALDEEEAQMEDMTNKMAELEKLLQQKDIDLESAEASRGKTLKKLSVTVSKFDELHHLSATLLSEVEKLQSQVQERDSEISFLRDEITRCTSDSLHASKNDERSLDEIRDILTWLDSMTSGVQKHDAHLDDKKIYQVHEYKEMLQKQITSIFSELESLREAAQSKDNLLHIERSRVEDLIHKGELLENSLREKESQLSMHQNVGDSSQATNMTSEIVEVEPVVNKWKMQGTSVAPQVRSLRKVNNEQVAIAINDMDANNRDRLEDEDDDKAHGFKSLTTSKIVPRFTRPVTDLIDGLWVSCDRALMRQPALRLGVILYWAVIHALLAIFVV